MSAVPTTATARTILERLAIDEKPWIAYKSPAGHEEIGVFHKAVFDLPGARGYVGLFKLEPGAELPTHVHRSFEHHALILEGGCVAGDRYLRAGSYEYVPPGVEHGIERTGPEGCTLFYVMLRS